MSHKSRQAQDPKCKHTWLPWLCPGSLVSSPGSLLSALPKSETWPRTPRPRHVKQHPLVPLHSLINNTPALHLAFKAPHHQICLSGTPHSRPSASATLSQGTGQAASYFSLFILPPCQGSPSLTFTQLSLHHQDLVCTSSLNPSPDGQGQPESATLQWPVCVTCFPSDTVSYWGQRLCLIHF